MNKRLLGIGQSDGFANSVRPRQIQCFRTDRGHRTEILDEVETLLEGTS